MPALDRIDKLAILADAAKYDASCASSGAKGRNSIGGKGVGSTEGSGICHAYTPDGRCISLLKILLTNYCMFDCVFCVNRISSNVQRARFTAREVAELTIDFYKRNYIEGLFLSSGIIRSPDYTMEQLGLVAKLLREEHDFRGYIHLKTIPEADPQIIDMAARHADRLSINLELPTEQGLVALAPEKRMPTIRRSMGYLRNRIEAGAEERKAIKSAPRIAPAGQSTQMIVGADRSTDAEIIGASAHLYGSYRLRRVYYSAFSPIPDASHALPLKPPPLMREHRLYQADWLLRHYGFSLDEVVASTTDGMFDMHIDPKLAWALKNRALFPVDVNRAPREMLLRVPGLGARAVDRLLAARRFHAMRLDDIRRLTNSAKRLLPFITTADWSPGQRLDSEKLPSLLRPKTQQLELFADG